MVFRQLVFLARNIRPEHPLVQSHYFRRQFIRFDPMHVLDLRGVIAICAGSMILKIISTNNTLGNNQDVRLAKINELMKEYQRTHGTSHRMPPLRINDLRTDGWGCLSGKVIKAANTRCMVPFLDNLAQTFFPAHGAYASSTRKLFASLLAVEKIFYSSGMFLTDTQKADLEYHLLRLGRHHQHLRHLSRLENENSYQITPKCHYAQHFIEQARLMNPTTTQNYSEESLIGVMTRIWQAAARGPYHKMIQRHTLNRYWTGLELRMSI